MFRNIFFVCMLFIFCVADIQACLCNSESPQKTIKHLQKSVDFIFAGKATDVGVTRSGNYATIVSRRQWKGKLALEKITIYSNGGCFVPFEVGVDFLIYAKIDDKGNLTTNMCMRSGYLRTSQMDIQVLGQPIYERNDEVQSSIFSPNVLESIELKLPPSVTVRDETVSVRKREQNKSGSDLQKCNEMVLI